MFIFDRISRGKGLCERLNVKNGLGIETEKTTENAKKRRKIKTPKNDEKQKRQKTPKNDNLLWGTMEVFKLDLRQIVESGAD